MDNYRVLLVDDDEINISTTRSLLRRWGYEVDAIANSDEALDRIGESSVEYAVAILDQRMPGRTGTELAKAIRQINNEISILIYSAYPSLEALKESLRGGGIVDFIEKNEDLEYLKAAVENACRKFEECRKVKPPLAKSEAERLIASMGMAGVSEKMARTSALVHKFRGGQKPVLILGETGVGKELIAKSLHAGHASTFFAVNCAAFENSSLLESELFGYEQGAFTGALKRKSGLLEAAGHGTVFLDEIHHLPVSAQPKLLRAIRERKIRRVGAHQETEIHCRIIAACRPDIEKRVADGRFLEDLYFRLKFLRIEVPALRDRPEDIPALVAFFSEKHFKETGVRKTFLESTIRYLQKYSWPGNIGELDGYISALLTSSDKAVIDPGELAHNFLVDGAPTLTEGTFAQLTARHDREVRQLLLYAIRSSKSLLHASQMLGMKHSSFHTLLTRMGLREDIKEAKASKPEKPGLPVQATGDQTLDALNA